jgi:hypothetical protein
MTEVVISLGRGPENQPVGWLKNASGDVVEFTGWLKLIRLLEDELRESWSLRADDPGGGSPAAPAPAGG